MPRSTFDLELADHAHDPQRKAAFTDRLFTDVAPVYDTFTLGPVSFFQDAGWKRWMVNHLPALPPGECIDAATGTGSIAFLLARRFPERRITGLDINRAMLSRAEQNNVFDTVRFRRMDMGNIDIGPESAALVTGGYALRNSPDLEQFLRDIHRMLKPGGVAAFLDFSKSPSPPIQLATAVGLRAWLSLWSLVLHRNLRVYNYIPDSLRYHPDRVTLGRLYDDTGFEIVRRRLFMGGIAAVDMLRRTP